MEKDPHYWDVKRLSQFESLFTAICPPHMSQSDIYDFTKNLGYSLQYVQFLINTLNKYLIHNVIQKQLIKTHIVVSMGIIETILRHCITCDNLHKTNDFVEVETFVSNKTIEGVPHRVKTILYRKLPEPTYEHMALRELIRKAERHDILSLSHSTYSLLQQLRTLRNKVHLEVLETKQHDWIFKEEHFQTMKSVLLSVLSSPRFNQAESSRLLDFLK